MKIRNIMDESGQSLVLGAVFLSLIMGFLALALDVGSLFRAREQMQIAADAAVAAAALDFKYAEPNSAQGDATAAATQNGMLATGHATLFTTPHDGYHESTGYTEVVVSEPYPTFFMHVFGFNTVDVTARAVAGSSLSGGCAWTLARSGTDISLSGNGSITMSGCDIYDDSAASNALLVTGNGSITAKAIGVVGGYQTSGNGTISPNPPTTGMAPAANPMSVPAPTPATGTCHGSSSACNVSNTGNSNVTVPAGTYTSISNSGNGNMTLSAGTTITGNLTNSGNGSLTLPAGNYTIGGNFSTSGNGAVTLGAGLYIVEGNLSLVGNGNLTGSGVTFYTEGSNAVTGNGSMSLSAPTSGTYNGVLFYQAASDSQPVTITGNGGDNLQGILYAPDSPVTLTGNGSLNVSLDIIADSMSVGGNGSITVTNYAASVNTNSVLGKLVMVE
jgi:hypothetical protein